MTSESFEIAGNIIHPGERKTIALPAPTLYTHAPLEIPVHVIHGKKPGPRLFVVAAIHGNEIGGVEIIRRLLLIPRFKKLVGTLVAVPVVNVYGFIALSRYLPDRRDLNRSFPGKKKGSLASRLAYLLMKEVINKCTHGIDLHTGTLHRSNLPQLRINLTSPKTRELADAFNVPVIINANLRDGSLREACNERGIPILVYEGGEALRFDEIAIRAGINGIFGIMAELGMIKKLKSIKKKKKRKATIAQSTTWVRAPHSGMLKPIKKLGDAVHKGEMLGFIADPFGEEKTHITAPMKGIIIGRVNLPLVNTGDALFHLACYHKIRQITTQIDELHRIEVVPF